MNRLGFVFAQKLKVALHIKRIGPRHTWFSPEWRGRIQTAACCLRRSAAPSCFLWPAAAIGCDVAGSYQLPTIDADA